MEVVQVYDRVFDRALARMLAKIALTVAVLAAGGRFAARARPGPSAYYLVDDLVASGLAAHEGEDLRVHGYVQTGSIERLNGDDALHRFQLTWHGAGVRVQAHGPLPDAFRDQAEVIVTGRLVHDGEWRIEGTAVIAKCAIKYDGAPVTPHEPRFQ
jgi:cytochrome c-type biogenesis protein CcmE